jgi:hypothetical protein
MNGPERMFSEHRREQRRSGIMWLILALVLAMTLGFSWRSDRRADSSDKRFAASNSQVDALKGQVTTNGELARSAKEAADEANRRLAAAGKPTVPVPSQPPVTPSAPPEGAQGPPGPQGPPGIQGPPGPVGLAGQSPVCLLLPSKCVGPKGATGPQGETGPQGPQGDPGATGETGPQGPAGPQGEVGPQGPAGADGKDGRGIADTDCQDDGTWLITYTDGTKQTARGPCRFVMPPATN